MTDIDIGTAIGAMGPGRNDHPDYDLLLGLLEPPAWHARAACKGLPTEWFIAPVDQAHPGYYDRARAVCAGCPVVDECRDAGTSQDGIWGGETRHERIGSLGEQTALNRADRDAEIMRLHTEGVSKRQIARTLDVPRATVILAIHRQSSR